MRTTTAGTLNSRSRGSVSPIQEAFGREHGVFEILNSSQSIADHEYTPSNHPILKNN